MNPAGRYKASFSKGGLMVPEGRVIADLLLKGIDRGQWEQAITLDNVLAKRSPSTAMTKAMLIRTRLRTMPPSIWQLIRDGDRSVATHAVLAATVTYSPLLGDFLDLVLRDLYRRFEPKLKRAHWDQYLADCRTRDPQMPEWSEATRTSLRIRAFGMLREAGYLSPGKSHELQPLRIAPEVIRALRDAERFYALRCIQLTDRDARMSSDFDQRPNKILGRITSDDFLHGRGLGNEIPFYAFDYPPEHELAVREHIAFLLAQIPKHRPGLGVAHVKLFDLIIETLKARNFYDKALDLQRKKGDAALLKALAAPLDAGKLAAALIDQVEPATTDIVLVSGVGGAYPLLRTHNLLNNLHAGMGSTPLVLFYPGVYDGQSLRLFGLLQDKPYYRAFRLVD